LTKGKQIDSKRELQLLKRSDLRKALNVGMELFRKWLHSGMLPEPVLIDGTPRWVLSEVQAWVAKLPRRTAPSGDEKQRG
jgi:predicted DNA-binding transcriptional regulator AlpA